MKTEFSWPVRVYYEDTDCGGVVYHTNYLKFMERARSEWLRSIGFEQDLLVRDYNTIFAVRSIDVQFKKPARFNDWLAVSSDLVRVRKTSIEFEQQVRLQDQPEVLFAHASVQIACLDAQKFCLVPLPQRLLMEISDER